MVAASYREQPDDVRGWASWLRSRRRASDGPEALGLRLFECVVDLLLDAPEVLRQQLLLVLREDAERHADDAGRELHVEPVLAVGDPTGDLEEEAAEASAARTELDLVPGHHAAVQLREEPEPAGLARHRREVVDRVALDLGAGLQRGQVRRAVFHRCRQ